MERHLDQSLEEIRQGLLRMGLEVEGMVALAMRALLERDLDEAEEVIRRDKRVDELEKSVDEQCHTVMATHQPTAGDLRFLVSVTKITNDLERVGDSAKNIAQAAIALSREAPAKPYVDLPKMGTMAGGMVRRSLDAFLEKDSGVALAVCQQDNEMDALYDKVLRELRTYMVEDPSKVGRGVEVLLVARDLERIGDHATNVAEQVIYYLEGRDIRHTPEGTGASPTPTGESS